MAILILILILLRVTRRWETLAIGRWGNPFRWGNPPVRIISHFNLITFTWLVACENIRLGETDVFAGYMIGGVTRQGGYPGLQDRITHRAEIKFCHVNVSKWGNPPSRGRIRDTLNSCKIHFGGGFASSLKVTRESQSTEDCTKSSKWV